MHANPINLVRLDHVVLRVNDIDLMVDFYANVLGCRLERVLEDLGLYQLRAGDSLIDLVDVSGPLGAKGGGVPDHSADNLDHLCLKVDPWDAERITTYLEARGVQFSPPADRYGATGMGPSIYLDDPEGNTVELKG